MIRQLAITLMIASANFPAVSVDSAEPLSSWNDTGPKQAILRFVATVTNPKSKDYVPPSERIAVFDNDGTLWAEQPIYFQLAFTIDRVKQLAADNPQWTTQEPFASVLRGDVESIKASGEAGIAKLLLATHTGMTTDAFRKVVDQWISKARHPKTGKLYTEMVYQPMLELLEFLRVNGFKTYIVSGGGIEFMRPWTQRVYGIPPQQVIGSSVKSQFVIQDGKPVIMRLPEIEFIDDKAGKPVGISQHIGRKPTMAFGNSDGDFEMLQWTTSGSGPRFGMLIHHTDNMREWAYDRQSHIGRLKRGLDEANDYGWIILDMKSDWSKVFSFDGHGN